MSSSDRPTSALTRQGESTETDDLAREVSKLVAWQCWAYTGPSRSLVVRGTAAAPTGRPSCLAFRNVSRIRLPWMIGVEAPQVEATAALSPTGRGDARHGTPRRVCPVRSAGGSFVDCSGARFYPHDPWLPGKRAPDWSGGTEWRGQLRRAARELPLFDGASLRLWRITPSHSHLALMARTPSHRCARLSLLGVEFLDLPSHLTNARLRLASDAEADSLCQRDPALAEYLADSPYLVIEATEGSFGVIAALFGYKWLRAPDYASLRGFSGPLWEAGPPLQEL
jgi:hypothetical protein